MTKAETLKFACRLLQANYEALYTDAEMLCTLVDLSHEERSKDYPAVIARLDDLHTMIGEVIKDLKKGNKK